MLVVELQQRIVDQGKELLTLRTQRDRLQITTKESEEKEELYGGALREIRTWLPFAPAETLGQAQERLTQIQDIINGAI